MSESDIKELDNRLDKRLGDLSKQQEDRGEQATRRPEQATRRLEQATRSPFPRSSLSSAYNTWQSLYVAAQGGNMDLPL